MTQANDYWRHSDTETRVSTHGMITRTWRTSPRLGGHLVLRPNPFYREWRDAEYVKNMSSYPGYKTYTPPYFAEWPLSDKCVASCQRAVIMKFYDDTNGIKANLADLFRTRAETLSMIASKLRLVAKAARAVRKGNFERASQIFGRNKYKRRPRVSKKKPFSQNWLEYQYGWAPLIGDIYTLSTDAWPDDIVGEVFVRGRESDSGSYTDYVPSHSHNFDYTWLCTSSVTIKAKLHISTGSLASAAAFGLTNPAVVVWEAVPWSFVVDWVLPIGNWLESMSALHGVRVEDFSMTTTTVLQQHASGRDSPYWTWGKNGFSAGFGDLVLKKKERSLLVPSFPFPRVKNPFSTSHALNAFALFRTNVR